MLRLLLTVLAVLTATVLTVGLLRPTVPALDAPPERTQTAPGWVYVKFASGVRFQPGDAGTDAPFSVSEGSFIGLDSDSRHKLAQSFNGVSLRGVRRAAPLTEETIERLLRSAADTDKLTTFDFESAYVFSLATRSDAVNLVRQLQLNASVDFAFTGDSPSPPSPARHYTSTGCWIYEDSPLGPIEVCDPPPEPTY